MTAAIRDSPNRCGLDECPTSSIGSPGNPKLGHYFRTLLVKRFDLRPDLRRVRLRLGSRAEKSTARSRCAWSNPHRNAMSPHDAGRCTTHDARDCPGGGVYSCRSARWSLELLYVRNPPATQGRIFTPRREPCAPEFGSRPRAVIATGPLPALERRRRRAS